MRAQSIFLGVCLFASAAFGAAGEYQETRDSKTTVWNGSPKPGESASWDGSRDKEGYASGFGTVTWYNANGTVYAIYYGNMVNGKLEGPVNIHTGNQKAHAYFVNGSRATAWARGAAPSKMNVPQELVAKRRKAESEPPKPREEKKVAAKPTPSATPVRPTEQPQKPEVAAATPKPAPTEPERSEQPKPESTPESIPSPPTVAEETRTIPTPEPTQTTSSFSEPPKIAETQETPSSFANETPPVSTPEPSVEQKPEAPAESASPEEPKHSEGTLSDLTGPPSSLRGGSIPESSTPPRSETKSRSSGTRGVAELSEDDAIGLADAEAKSRGYPLSEYQRPKADYSAVKDKWSLFYTLKDPKAAGGDLQPFSVTVEDKTKKVEVRRNY